MPTNQPEATACIAAFDPGGWVIVKSGVLTYLGRHGYGYAPDVVGPIMEPTLPQLGEPMTFEVLYDYQTTINVRDPENVASDRIALPLSMMSSLSRAELIPTFRADLADANDTDRAIYAALILQAESFRHRLRPRPSSSRVQLAGAGALTQLAKAKPAPVAR